MNIYFPAKVSNKHIPASDFLQQSPSNDEENCRLGGRFFILSFTKYFGSGDISKERKNINQIFWFELIKLT